MDRGLRDDLWKSLPERVRRRSTLGELTREYSLSEIAVLTRAGPARMLGLRDKGHLGPGADGDVTIYASNDDKERMFALPRHVIKAGEVVIDDGEIRSSSIERTLHVSPPHDPSIVDEIGDWIARDYTVQFANYPVALEEVANPLRCMDVNGETS